MPERKQPTPIDADEYDQFVEFVKDRHGGIRGYLRGEIESALREYRERYGGGGPVERIEDDIAAINARLAQIEADGGVDVCDEHGGGCGDE